MTLNPSVFIIVGAICAALSVITATVTLFAEHKRIRAEKRIADEQARLVTIPSGVRATTKSDAAVRIQEVSGARLQPI